MRLNISAAFTVQMNKTIASAILLLNIWGSCGLFARAERECAENNKTKTSAMDILFLYIKGNIIIFLYYYSTP